MGVGLHHSLPFVPFWLKVGWWPIFLPPSRSYWVGERFLQPTEFEAESLPSCGMRPIWPIDKKMLALRVFVLPVYGVKAIVWMCAHFFQCNFFMKLYSYLEEAEVTWTFLGCPEAMVGFDQMGTAAFWLHPVGVQIHVWESWDNYSK